MSDSNTDLHLRLMRRTAISFFFLLTGNKWRSCECDWFIVSSTVSANLEFSRIAGLWDQCKTSLTGILRMWQGSRHPSCKVEINVFSMKECPCWSLSFLDVEILSHFFIFSLQYVPELMLRFPCERQRYSWQECFFSTACFDSIFLHKSNLILQRVIKISEAWKSSPQRPMQHLLKSGMRCRTSLWNRNMHTANILVIVGTEDDLTSENKDVRSSSVPTINYQVCGKKHNKGKWLCPAYGTHNMCSNEFRTCVLSKYQKKNHFAAKCKMKINFVETTSERCPSGDDAHLHGCTWTMWVKTHSSADCSFQREQLWCSILMWHRSWCENLSDQKKPNWPATSWLCGKRLLWNLLA